MKRVVWIGLALFLLAMIGIPGARADSYKPAFTCDGGNCSHSAAPFRDVSFDWIADSGHRDAHRIARKESREAFANGNTGDNDGDDQGSMGTTSGTNTGSGTCSCGSSSTTPSSSPTTAATPEPSTVVLMLLGVGLLFLTRKRFIPSVRNT